MCGPHASLCSSVASHPTYGPAKAEGRSQTWPVEDLGPHHHLVWHQCVGNIINGSIDIIILCIIRIGFHVISIPFRL